MTERIILQAEDIRHLLLGGEVQTPQGNAIIIPDLGYPYLRALVQEAEESPNRLMEVQEQCP